MLWLISSECATLEIWSSKAVWFHCRSVMRSQYFIAIAGQVDLFSSDCIRWWVLINVKRLFPCETFFFLAIVLKTLWEKLMHHRRERKTNIEHSFISQIWLCTGDARNKFPIWDRIDNLLVLWTFGAVETTRNWLENGNRNWCNSNKFRLILKELQPLSKLIN